MSSLYAASRCINHCPQGGDATTPSLLGERPLTLVQLERRLVKAVWV